MNDYKQSQFVTIVLDGRNGTATFNKSINVSFGDVKGFFVRQITATGGRDFISINQTSGVEVNEPDGSGDITTYVMNNSNTYFYNIYTDLINDYIGTILIGSTVTPHVYYPLKNIQRVNDSFMFRLDNLSSPSSNVNEVIIIQLEFVK
jgi:hypothetical protein